MKIITPLTIISLFISLTELTLGYALVQTTGGIQVAITVFVILFPVLIACTFFYILWHKNYVFYHPEEFRGTSVENYVSAMSAQKVEVQQKVMDEISAIKRLVGEELSRDLQSKIVGEKSAKVNIPEEFDRAFRSVLDKKYITLDLSDFKEIGRSEHKFVIDDYKCVNELLNSVYFMLKNDVLAYTYGKMWILKNQDNDQYFSEIGTQWARNQGKITDDRGLQSVGIRPGMRIKVVKL